MKTDKDQRGGLPGRISGRLPGGSSKTMTALRESETLTEMLCGEAIWSLLWAAGILIFSKDRLHAIAGLAIGTALALFYTVNLYMSVEGSLDFDEKGAIAYTRKKYLIRYLVVCAVFVVTALTGIGSIFTCFAGIMGIKLGAYLQPLVRRYIFKRIDPPGEPMPDEPDSAAVHDPLDRDGDG